tara:strand:+ start:49 stop:246 length:198 start_codon:yes stop_codon:yes gene_type:complete
MLDSEEYDEVNPLPPSISNADEPPLPPQKLGHGDIVEIPVAAATSAASVGVDARISEAAASKRGI